MLKSFSLFVAIFIAASHFSATALAQTYNPPPKPSIDTTSQYGVYVYSRYFPKEISGVGFKMPKTEFLAKLQTLNIDFKANRDNDRFLVSVPGAKYKEVIYDFGSNAGEILTEIEIRFTDSIAAEMYFNKHYSPQQEDGKFGIFNETAQFRGKAWHFGHKIFFVAVMADTRWSNQ